jgi:hypothetical protein
VINSPEMDSHWILVAGGAAFLAGSAPAFKAYWPLWRRGVETRATVVKALTPYRAHIRFRDLAGQDHLVEDCAAPRFGQFVEGGGRGLTYLPSNPAKWEWGRRKDHRFMVFLGMYLVAVGLGMLIAGLKPLLITNNP